MMEMVETLLGEYPSGPTRRRSACENEQGLHTRYSDDPLSGSQIERVIKEVHGPTTTIRSRMVKKG